MVHHYNVPVIIVGWDVHAAAAAAAVCCVRECERVRVCECASACMCMLLCACACMCACMHECVRTCVHVCLCVCVCGCGSVNCRGQQRPGLLPNWQETVKDRKAWRVGIVIHQLKRDTVHQHRFLDPA